MLYLDVSRAGKHGTVPSGEGARGVTLSPRLPRSSFAFAGCFAAAVPARAASSLSLVILPDQGENAIYNFVNSAASSIDVTIYELKDTTLVNDLIAREKAGVNVRVILDQA